MDNQNLIITKLEGFSGIRLKDKKPLEFKPGINLLVGRNGCGKSNLLRLLQVISTGNGKINDCIESTFFNDNAKKALLKKRSTITARFGKVTIVEHNFLGKNGHVQVSLKNVTEDRVLRNLLQDGTSFQGHLDVSYKYLDVNHQQIFSREHPPKFEMSGYGPMNNLLSKEHENPAHAMMDGSIQVVANFIRDRLLEIYASPEFLGKIQDLERNINKTFFRFLGTSRKQVKIEFDGLAESRAIHVSLVDNGNFIKSENMSTGEAILCNLVFALEAAKREAHQILCLDEPDIHMHDDMVQVLVDELCDLVKTKPDRIVIIASHSTALIERLANLGAKKTNIIVFDLDRNVGNAEREIDLINALARNGVTFSPLMLSKRKNIFIENLARDEGLKHKQFFEKFFCAENLPNIIPIGNSGNVNENDSFSTVLKDILKANDVRSVGIQDGDIWFKKHLRDYLEGTLELNHFVQKLKKQRRMYIRSTHKQNAYFFNFWEIENLYLMDEALSSWVNKRKVLNATEYRSILQSQNSTIVNQYLKTFIKSISHIRIGDTISIEKTRADINKRFALINELLGSNLQGKTEELVKAVIKNDLLQWVPGKEIRRAIESLGYHFDNDRFDFEGSRMASEVRKILAE